MLRAAFAYLLVTALCTPDARAQIRTDGSLGHPAQTLTGPNFVIPQSLGLVSGANLFQSFSTFNLASGEAAYFTTTSAGIANIISRITGGSPSILNGNINVLAASGAPNFFFINPSGVTFGNGASINVPAGLHVSTASYLKFADGNFYSDTVHTSTFSTLAPEAFGFLGTSRATVSLSDGSALIQSNAPVSVVAGDVSVDDSAIGTFGTGDVRVAAVGMDRIEVPLTGALPLLHGDFQVLDGAEIFSSATALNGGNVLVSAGNITVDAKASPYFTGIYSDAPQGSSGNAGSVQILAAGTLSMNNAGAISATTESSGNVAGMNVTVAGNIALQNGAQIYSSTSSTGNTGPMLVSAGGPITMTSQAAISATTAGSGLSGPLQVASAATLSLTTGAEIYAASYGTGNAGDVRVQAASILIDGAGGQGATGILDYAAKGGGSGNAGDLDVTVTGNATLADGAFINAASFGPGNAGNINLVVGGNLLVGSTSLIGADALSSGAAGTVAVSAANVTLTGSQTGVTGIGSSSQHLQSGPAGAVSVSTPGALTITNGASITTSSSSEFDAGAVKISAGSVYMSADGNAIFETGISADALGGNGNAGSIDVAVAGSMIVRDGADILANSDFSSGNSGQIKITAGSLKIDGAGTTAQISSDMLSLNPNGRGGDVEVNVSGPLTILGAGSISADTYVYGSAGSVAVAAQDITLNGQDTVIGAAISSTSHSTFAGANSAGSVAVNSPGTIVLMDNGSISSSTREVGSAGLVSVAANDIDITGFLSGIYAEVLSGSGVAGSVMVTAGNSITLSDLAEISIASAATATPPNTVPALLSISAPNIMLSKGAAINALALGNAPASDILIKFSQDLILDPSAISTQSVSGNGGSITIQGGQLLELDRSHITTSVSGPSGNGGDISIRSTALVLDSGSIQANTVAANANGGNVSINVDALVPSGSTLFVGGDTPYPFLPYVFGFNVIQAAAPTGLSGTINISSPALDLSSSLSALAEKLLTDTGLGRDRCHGALGSSLAQGGRGGFAPSARELARADGQINQAAVARLDKALQLAAFSGNCVH